MGSIRRDLRASSRLDQLSPGRDGKDRVLHGERPSHRNRATCNRGRPPCSGASSMLSSASRRTRQTARPRPPRRRRQLPDDRGAAAGENSSAHFYRISTELGRSCHDSAAPDNTSTSTFPLVDAHFREPANTSQHGRNRFDSPHLHSVMSRDVPGDRTHVYGFGCLFFGVRGGASTIQGRLAPSLHERPGQRHSASSQLAPMPSAPGSIAPCWCSRSALLATQEWHEATRELWRSSLSKIRYQFARRLWWIPLSARSKADSLDDRTLLLPE
jgi:hypothetical protein